MRYVMYLSWTMCFAIISIILECNQREKMYVLEHVRWEVNIAWLSLYHFFFLFKSWVSIGLIKLEKCVIYAYQFLLGLMRSLISEWSQAAKEFQWAKLWCPLFKFFTWSSPRVKNKVLRNSECMQVLNPLTPKISLVILLNVCHTVLVVLVWRILFCINSKSPHW